MSDPWAEFNPQPAAGPSDPWAEFNPQPAPATKKKYAPYKGEVLPFSRDEEGGFHFDSDAGILGSLKRVVTLPREVYEGKVDPLSDEGLSRTREMAATVAPVTPGLRAGDMSGLFQGKPVAGKPVTPTAAELKSAGSAGFDATRASGVDYSPQHVGELSDRVRNTLDASGFRRAQAPQTHGILDDLIPPAGRPGETPVAPIDGLISARQTLGNVAKDFNHPVDQAAARRAMGQLEEFLEGNTPGSVVAGPAAEAARTYRNANANYAAGKRAEGLDKLEYNADLQTAASHSGLNAGNTLKQQVKNLLKSDKRRLGFNADEIAQLEGAVEGTVVSNRARQLSKLLGSGGGLGQVAGMSAGAGAGAAIAGPIGGYLGPLAVMAAGSGLRRLSDRIGRKQFDRVNQSTRQRSPLYEERAANPPMTQVSPEARAALIRELELYMLQPEQDEPNFLRVSPGRR